MDVSSWCISQIHDSDLVPARVFSRKVKKKNPARFQLCLSSYVTSILEVG